MAAWRHRPSAADGRKTLAPRRRSSRLTVGSCCLCLDKTSGTAQCADGASIWLLLCYTWQCFVFFHSSLCSLSRDVSEFVHSSVLYSVRKTALLLTQARPTNNCWWTCLIYYCQHILKYIIVFQMVVCGFPYFLNSQCFPSTPCTLWQNNWVNPSQGISNTVALDLKTVKSEIRRMSSLLKKSFTNNLLWGKILILQSTQSVFSQSR